jgi:hypothetical protein
MLVYVYTLGAADILLLAAALTWCKQHPAQPGFISGDERLCHPAEADLLSSASHLANWDGFVASVPGFLTQKSHDTTLVSFHISSSASKLVWGGRRYGKGKESDSGDN